MLSPASIRTLTLLLTLPSKPPPLLVIMIEALGKYCLVACIKTQYSGCIVGSPCMANSKRGFQPLFLMLVKTLSRVLRVINLYSLEFLPCVQLGPSAPLSLICCMPQKEQARLQPSVSSICIAFGASCFKRSLPLHSNVISFFHSFPTSFGFFFNNFNKLWKLGS